MDLFDIKVTYDDDRVLVRGTISEMGQKWITANLAAIMQHTGLTEAEFLERLQAILDDELRLAHKATLAVWSKTKWEYQINEPSRGEQPVIDDSRWSVYNGQGVVSLPPYAMKEGEEHAIQAAAEMCPQYIYFFNEGYDD